MRLYTRRLANANNAALHRCEPGVELVLYFASVTIILTWRERTNRDGRLFLYFSTGLLLMITIYVAVQAVFGQEMWIVHADYPGGSAVYLADNAAVWYQTLGSAASVVLNLMSDGLLVRIRTSIPCTYFLTLQSSVRSYTDAMSCGE